MELIEKKYHAKRGKTEYTYQYFIATLEISGNRRYITVELENLQRWRSKEEYADYLRWCAEEILKLPTEE